MSMSTPTLTVGSRWQSRDPRDCGVYATVIGYDGTYVYLQRFRKSRVRRDRFLKEYAPA